MSKILRIFMAILTCSLFGLIAIVGIYEKLYFVTVLALLIGVASFWVWAKKGNLSYRFLYPGILCFLIFTILPIVFSILISFTNLGTGHFFSKEEALSLIRKETYLPSEAVSHRYKLFKKAGKERKESLPQTLYIQTSKEKEEALPLMASFTLREDSSTAQEREKEKEVLLKKEALQFSSQEFTPLTLAETYALSPLLRKYTFRTPQGVKLLYHRTDILLEKKPLYLYDKEKDILFNERTGEEFVNNPKVGFYKSPRTGERILPGYYTIIGLKNYSDVFTNPSFKRTFLKVSLWTFLWAGLSVALTFSLGMSLAIFLNDKKLKGKIIYRNLLILPYSIPFFISVLVFKGMLSKDFGVINEVLKTLTLSPIPWLEDALWAKISCLMVNLWLGFPYMFLLTTGILQSIPESVYEAARIDGANRWQRFRSITLPMILSSITPLLIGSFAFNLGNFVGIYLLTGGGPSMPGATTPAGETDILISYTYRLAFEGAGGQLFGMASSIALFIFVIITGLTIINFKIFNVHNQGESS